MVPREINCNIATEIVFSLVKVLKHPQEAGVFPKKLGVIHMNSYKPLSRKTIWLHWIVAIGMIVMLIAGNIMVRTENFGMMPMHKTIGTVLFIFIIWRVFYRLRKGWPEDISEGPKWEHVLARIVHWVLIIGTILMPLSGILGSYFGGFGWQVFGLDILSMNIGENGRPEAINKGVATFFGAVHGITSKVLLLAIFLHIAGALKHAFIDHDGTLRRMLGMKPKS